MQKVKTISLLTTYDSKFLVNDSVVATKLPLLFVERKVQVFLDAFLG